MTPAGKRKREFSPSSPRASKTQRKTTLFSAAQPIVVLHVGDPVVAVSIHEHVLTASSRFFETAVKKEWTKELPRTIDHKGEDPEVFAVYTNWLYTKQFALGDEVDTPEERWELLTRLYLFGEEYIDARFKDTVIDRMKRCLANKYKEAGHISSKSIARSAEALYKGTLPGSKCRTLLAEWFATIARSGLLPMVKDIPELVFDVAMLLMLNRTRHTVTDGFQEHISTPCFYHEHAHGKKHCRLSDVFVKTEEDA